MRFTHETMKGIDEIVLNCAECGNGTTIRADNWNMNKTLSQLKASALCEECEHEKKARRRKRR